MRLFVITSLLVCLVTPGCAFTDASSPTRHAPTAGEELFMLGVPDTDHGPVNGVFLYTMDAETGTLVQRDLPKLGIGDPPRFLDVTGGRLAYFGTYGTTFSIDLDLREPPKLLGRSLYFVPSATDGRVWLRGKASVHEVTVDGDVIAGGPMPRPPCGWLEGAVQKAIICQARKSGMVAVSPRTGRTTGRIPDTSFPIAIGKRLVASCDEPCPRLQLTDPVAHVAFSIRPRGPFTWQAGYDGAFSPDDTLVAVPVRPRRTPAGHPNARQVAIVDLAARSASLVPGGRLRIDGPLAFSSSGDLYFVAPNGEVMRYEPASRDLSSVGSAARIRVYDLTAS
jgi:hypothetical protein